MGRFVHGTVRPRDESFKKLSFGDILYSLGHSLKARSLRNASKGEVQKVHGTLINKRSALYVLAESVSDQKLRRDGRNVSEFLHETVPHLQGNFIFAIDFFPMFLTVLSAGAHTSDSVSLDKSGKSLLTGRY